MSFAGDILRSKRQELAAQMTELRKSIRELDAAMELLGEAEPGKSGGSSASSPINAAIVEAVSQGHSTPAHIFDYVVNVKEVDTSKNSVSTRLSKLRNDGLIDHDGHGWVLAKAEGSGVDAPEPSIESGPVTGRERGYPPSAPEGSIPSGSTVVHRPAPSRELDDDIPF